jgi:hypothetical protein
MFQPPPRQYQQAPGYPPPGPPPGPPPAPAPEATPPEPAAPAAAPAADDMGRRLALLQQLGGLRAQGILTDAEFEAQKSKLLGA